MGKLTDRRVARIVKSCQDLPGQHLFQYVDEDGTVRAIGSADVNGWLRDVSGTDITAKDFRTWAGTVLAAMALHELADFDRDVTAKANIRDAIERVARRLGNTPTICRKCYVLPEILTSYLDGALALRGVVPGVAGVEGGLAALDVAVPEVAHDALDAGLEEVVLVGRRHAGFIPRRRSRSARYARIPGPRRAPGRRCCPRR